MSEADAINARTAAAKQWAETWKMDDPRLAQLRSDWIAWCRNPNTAPRSLIGMIEAATGIKRVSHEDSGT